MWDLPGPGLEPASPALAGGFLTTAPPGKLPYEFLNRMHLTRQKKETFTVSMGIPSVPKRSGNLYFFLFLQHSFPPPLLTATLLPYLTEAARTPRLGEGT